MKNRLLLMASLILSHLSAFAQLSNQGYTTNYGGGSISGGTYSTEITTGQVGGIPKSENFGFYPGLSSFNMESGTITISASSEGSVITEGVEGILLRVQGSGNYDTLDIGTSNDGNLTFNPVFLASYLINIDSDPDTYVATYYGEAFLWEEAEVLVLEGDTTTQVVMELVPPELTSDSGDGNVSGTVTEDFEDENGRIDARRRAAKRKCGLRRKRNTGGRTGQEEEIFDLIAYGETNDEGEFEYGFLPEGTYRFFVEYPGIPLDESSFVQFDVGEAGVSDNTFVLAAVVTETGITVELVLGITSEFFTDFSIYPNPTMDVVHIDYDKIISDKMIMDVIDMNGKILESKELNKSENGKLQLSLKEYNSGHYLLRFLDAEKNKVALTFRIIKQ